jgi:hypothetical protein
MSHMLWNSFPKTLPFDFILRERWMGESQSIFKGIWDDTCYLRNVSDMPFSSSLYPKSWELHKILSKKSIIVKYMYGAMEMSGKLSRTRHEIFISNIV